VPPSEPPDELLEPLASVEPSWPASPPPLDELPPASLPAGALHVIVMPPAASNVAAIPVGALQTVFGAKLHSADEVHG